MQNRNTYQKTIVKPRTFFKADFTKLDKHKLSKLSIPNTEIIENKDLDTTILHVNNEHALTQAIGYLKFVNKDNFNILYRGQASLYPTLLPSLFRVCPKAPSQSAISKRNELINDFLDGPGKTLFERGIPRYAYEPLLQHYGIKTRWIDLVDNHWVALWFAAHAFYSTQNQKNVHFERRLLGNGTDDNYAYILLIAVPKFWMNTAFPGLYEDESAKLIDLRVACPSNYIRPHAQHGYLLFQKNANPDLSGRLAGIVRLPLQLANNLIGRGGLISGTALFPPPYYDGGYSFLLQQQEKIAGAIPSELGIIYNIYPCA